jgi:hypothetical protein
MELGSGEAEEGGGGEGQGKADLTVSRGGAAGGKMRLQTVALRWLVFLSLLLLPISSSSIFRSI